MASNAPKPRAGRVASETLRVRLTPAEMRKLKKAASHPDLKYRSLSDYVRARLGL